MKLLLILLLSGTILPVYAEDYYYFQEQKLSTVPEFCIIEFEDTQLPGASDTLYQITINAIQEWEDKLVRHTGEKQGWDFTYKVITQEQYDDIFSEDVCDITIFYEREPTTAEELTTAGHTYALWGFADITIFYLEPVWVFTGQTSSINGEIYEIADISHFKNSLDPYNDETIKHEIGHALGLDHYPAKTSEIKKQNGINLAPSIMTLSESDAIIDRKEITDYDIRSLVNLYGEDGINELDQWIFLDYLLYGFVILVVLYFVKRKWGKKKFNLIPFDTTDTETTRCIRCSRMISAHGHSICKDCLQKDDFGV
jgi:predicted Zn-dependent protease